jgi:hypothetical protein
MALSGIFLNFVNVCLLFALLVIFWSQWRRTKAAFSMGLVLFALVFLLKELLDLLRVLGRAQGIPGVGSRIEPLVTLGEAIALAILLYIVAR